jgi:aminopeptidase-like protein
MIDEMITKRKPSSKLDKLNKINNGVILNSILKDDEIQQIKREKMEKEYIDLINEVKEFKKEVFF